MPPIDGFDDESILSISHLGIVAGAYDSLGVANIINIANTEYNDSVVEKERKNLGRFVLATNDRGIFADELLTNYKAQGSVERGFRFLKDKSFRVAEIF